MEWLASFVPDWLLQWVRLYVAPLLRVKLRAVLRTMLVGATDALIFISLPVGISLGSQAVWNARYHLTTAQQAQVERWTSVSQLVAYIEDVPPVVPLVLWLKEAGMETRNPNNCEGIMGLHSAVNSGQLPCFPSGPIDEWEVAYQLQLGARTFKNYCPEVTYFTTNPRLLKQCYLYYNAGPRSTLSPDRSGYVMNGYDSAHQNMILTDVQGRRYRLTALGAWPAHLAIQAQLAQRNEPPAPLALLAPAMLTQELLDRVWASRTEQEITFPGSSKPEGTTAGGTGAGDDTPERAGVAGAGASCHEPQVFDCFVSPHEDGNAKLRPQASPLLVKPEFTGELRCGTLPGIDLVPGKPSLVLAPLSGELTRYADGAGHLAVQIENEEWTVWITGLRSYVAPEGPITVGDTIGAIGGVHTRTPSIHYSIYDNVNLGFVDTLSFLPGTACPSYF